MTTVTTESKTLELEIPAGNVVLAADAVIPADATGVVLFAHGSGSSRHSPRNQFVASALHSAGSASALALESYSTSVLSRSASRERS